ncbi:MAG: hypothetical protein ABSB81_09925 [Halobacteriota archaeon]|jgi:hypothetical protein
MKVLVAHHERKEEYANYTTNFGASARGITALLTAACFLIYQVKLIIIKIN